MNKLKYFIYISTVNILIAGEGGGSWINDWLMPNTGLTLWTIVTFLLLLLILRWKAWGPLMDALDARSKQIEESLSKAEKNEAILQKARKEAQKIVTKAREAGDKLKHKLETDGKDQYDNMLGKAKDQINAEKQKAMNEIKSTVVDIAIQASEKVIKRNLNNEDNKKMIEQTVDEFKQAN